MTRIKRSLATAAVIAAGLAAAAPAHAQSPQGFVVDGPFTAQGGQQGIIAILIGLHQRAVVHAADRHRQGLVHGADRVEQGLLNLVQPVVMTGPTSTLSSQIHAGCAPTSSAGATRPGTRCPRSARLSEEFETSRHARARGAQAAAAGRAGLDQPGRRDPRARLAPPRRAGAAAARATLPEALQAPRAAMEMRACIGADAARRCARSGPTSRCGRRSARARSSSPRSRTSRRRNAHYEVLWDLIVDGADNIAYRLALTTLAGAQRHRVGRARRGARASSRTRTRSARSAAAIAGGRRRRPRSRPPASSWSARS